MKGTILLFAVAVAFLTLGVAQTPAPLAMTNTATSITGCLGGSEGAYRVAQDGSTQTLKITSSSVDLKAHIGHQVELTGQKSSAAVFGAPETVSVTGVSMISEHCPVTAAISPTPADPTTASLTTPATATAAPGANAPVSSTPAAISPGPDVAATPAAPASASVVMASAKQTLPNTAAPPLKAVKITGNLGADGKTFVSDKDSKSWTVTNPDFGKGHEGHHVTLTAHVDTVKREVEIVALKMAKSQDGQMKMGK
jgi:hypothetical protein